MPLLRSLNLFGIDFYKDVTPTAFGIGALVNFGHYPKVEYERIAL